MLREFILGITQGLTEFLPISSSGHLVLMSHYFDLEQPNLFEVTAYHIGTLIAVIFALRQSIKKLFFPRIHWPMIICLGLTTFVTSVVGLALRKTIGSSLESPVMVSGFLIVTALLLVMGSCLPGTGRNKDPAEPHNLTWTKAIIIGLVQGLSAFPGISRSGSTLTASYLCRLHRNFAVEYSFLASIPVIAGAFVYELLQNREALFATEFSHSIWIGVFLSAASGWAALHWLLRFLKTNSMIPFSIYCGVMGGISLMISLL